MDFPRQEIFDNESKRTHSYIHNHYPDFEQYLSDHYNFAIKWSEKLYCYYHDINSRVTCLHCKNPVKFISLDKGYNKYCSVSCASNSDIVRNKTKQTNLARYGVEHIIQLDTIKDKIKQTNLKKYGVENASQSSNIKNKRTQTNIERYGVKNPFQASFIKNKIKQTNLKIYGVEYALQSDIIKNKVKQTNFERYGVEHALQSDTIKNKFKQTNFERYGVEYATQSNIIKNKTKQTNLRRYGVEYYTQSEEGRNRLKGAISSDNVQNKINNTKHLNNTFNTSSVEEEFASYLDHNNILYKRQYKSKEYPFNCDFYIPKYDLYIEIQASWLHGDHPYNKEKDKEKLEHWKSKQTKFYNNAIETWTIRDVKKRNTAKLNNLNYLEIFNSKLDIIIDQFEQYINNI